MSRSYTYSPLGAYIAVDGQLYFTFTNIRRTRQRTLELVSTQLIPILAVTLKFL